MVMITLTNPAFPHSAVITRTVLSATVPFTATTSTIWSGAVDCQTARSGATGLRETVFVSDYTIYSECIASELLTGDIITVTFKDGGTPVICQIEQYSTDEIYQEDGVSYGTTIWANVVKS